MKIKFGKATFIVLMMSVAFFGTANAAYIDLNTGGMLFQILAVLIGVLSGLLLLFSSQVKKVYYRIKRSLRGSKPEQIQDNQADEQN